jgi:hypothetical protein
MEGVPTPAGGTPATPDVPSADVPPPPPTLGPREVPAADGEPLEPVARGASTTANPAEGDWLASICPYLASEDGTYRSAEAHEGHRCTAQDPPATLPLAFQVRFCLTDRLTRCVR